MALKINEKAPDFSLTDKDGKEHSLSGISSRYTIVYFYPKDDTPGCTLEAQMFDRDMEEYRSIGAEIIGISGGDDSSKKKFCSKYGLTLTLLSDPDLKISKEYGTYGEKAFLGKKFMGISRTTFILDGDKKVIRVFEKVNPVGHSKAVLDYIKSLDKA